MENNTIKITGHVSKVLSKNFNSWKTIQVVSDKKFPNSTNCYGKNIGMISGDNLEGLPMDRDIEFTCRVKGPYLNCVSWTPAKAQSNTQIRKFIENILYKENHLATKKAIAELVETYGENTLELFETRETNKLMPYFGNAQNVLEACRLISKLDKGDNYFRFMAEHNVSRSKAVKIYDQFGDDSLDVIQRNPFLCMEIDGIGFKTCDEIAKSLNSALDSKERILAGTKFVVSALTDAKGDIAIEVNAVMKKTLEILAVDGVAVVNSQKWLEVIKEDLKEAYSNFVFFNGNLMLKRDSENERKTSLKICNMLNYGSAADYAYDNAVRINNSRTMQLVESQMAAVKKCLSSPISVLTGGPGTGKTTVIKTVIEAYKASCSYPVTCMAPTGKAASRMSEATGEKAHTIHKTLNIIPGLEKKDVVTLPIGLIIIDELSMIDQETMTHLMDAVPTRAQVIFVGDIDQCAKRL